MSDAHLLHHPVVPNYPAPDPTVIMAPAPADDWTATTGDRVLEADVVIVGSGPGGGAAARGVLEVLHRAGARPADPGEFTRRAFLNGKIDLVQAEAISALIAARGDRARELAMAQLDSRAAPDRLRRTLARQSDAPTLRYARDA